MGSYANYRPRVPIIGHPYIFLCSIIGQQHEFPHNSFRMQNWYRTTPPRCSAPKTAPYQPYSRLFLCYNFCMCFTQIKNNAKYTILANFLEANVDISTPEKLSGSDRILRQFRNQHTPRLTSVYQKNQSKQSYLLSCTKYTTREDLSGGEIVVEVIEKTHATIEDPQAPPTMALQQIISRHKDSVN